MKQLLRESNISIKVLILVLVEHTPGWQITIRLNPMEKVAVHKNLRLSLKSTS